MTTAFSFGRFELRPASHELLEDGRAVALGARAFGVLQALIEHRERTVTKDELLDLVWPGVVVEENNLQVQISTLRKILGPLAIATIPGRGYRLTLEERPKRGPVSEPTSPTTTGGSEPTVAEPDSLDMAATNLPTRQAALIGREEDVRAVEDLLAKQGLVSIVGAGGIGKTRLALAVALGQRAAFPDGVWWVDLASINDPGMVPNAVAQAAGIASAVERPTAALLVSVLRRSRSLLVLDNCEHLLEQVAQTVDALLRACPGVRIVVTSQEPLKLAGEQIYRLGPLAVPREDEPVDERTAAVALFVARAQTHDRRLKFDAATLVIVASICRELDGLPLAIELAAARVPLLGLDGLRVRLNERFKVLTGGSRIELRRHQTLRAAIEWSHGLLTDDERIVFRRLGVFTGGFSLPLAQAVASDTRIDAWTLLELLSHLVDKSLVATDLRDTAVEPRYRLLESARAYALEQLAAAGETQSLLRRHAQALHDFLLPLQLRYWSLTAAERSAAVAELDNLRAAHDWSVGPEGDHALGCALLAASRVTWFGSGQLLEGVERCLRVPAVPLSTDVEAHLKLTIAHLGNFTARADCFEAAGRAADLFCRLGDAMSRVDALISRAIVGSRRGMTTEVGEALDVATCLVRPDWPLWLRGRLAVARMQYLLMADDAPGALDAAWHQHECYREDREDRAQRGFLVFVQAIALSNVAVCETALGRYDLAIERLEGALNQKQRLGLTLGNLARTLALRNGPGDVERAFSYGREAWPLLRRQQHATWLLEAIGVAHAQCGAPEFAARLIGHARAVRAHDGEVELPWRRRFIGRVLEELRARHGQSQVDGWCTAGAALNDDEAASLAFGSVTSDPRPAVA